MNRYELSTPTWLEEKLWSAYTGLMIFTIWFPYIWPVAYVCGIILGLMLARKWLTNTISTSIGVSFHQKEQLLFIDDAATLRMTVHGLNQMTTLGIPLSVRVTLGRGITFENGSSTTTLDIEPDEADVPLTIQAEKRGPVKMNECIVSARLPFFLGTVLLVDAVESLPEWTVLPSIKKMNVSDSKHYRVGDRLVKHSPLKDQLMILSSKSYEAEPAKQIDWYASAKTGRLQAKVFQRQNLDTFTLMLDLSGPLGNGLHARYEELIQQAAYLVSYLVKEDCKVELFINRLDADNHIDHLRMSDGRKQLRLALVRLAGVHESDRFVASKRFNQIIERQKHPHAEVIRIDTSLLKQMFIS
ncbi:DUF58 domain-containing protein [Exiguobacterium sp. SL-10]|uniref:DUF58 domain-containing protein n=1 Tax=Exiguobacterium sp. SL-10 TaxID=2510962 RepID=UPI001F23A675|nr:DUF58 domain-containing protein [Exiguobacterium sp. SL-10]